MVALSLPRFCDRQVADISDPASRVEVESLSDDLIKIIISVNVGYDTVVVDFVQVSKQPSEPGRITVITIDKIPCDHPTAVQCVGEGEQRARHIEGRKAATAANEPKIRAIKRIVPGKARILPGIINSVYLRLLSQGRVNSGELSVA